MEKPNDLRSAAVFSRNRPCAVQAGKKLSNTLPGSRSLPALKETSKKLTEFLKPLILLFYFNPFYIARFLKGFAQLLKIRRRWETYKQPDP